MDKKFILIPKNLHLLSKQLIKIFKVNFINYVS